MQDYGFPTVRGYPGGYRFNESPGFPYVFYDSKSQPNALSEICIITVCTMRISTVDVPKKPDVMNIIVIDYFIFSTLSAKLVLLHRLLHRHHTYLTHI